MAASSSSRKSAGFPAARIKRIMQQDDDVGKLAQGSPVAVGKALELFVKDLVEAAASQAHERNSNKVSLYHFKRAILEEPSFDFLKEHVASIPDPVEKEKKPRRPRAPKDPDAPKMPRKRKAAAKAEEASANSSAAAADIAGESSGGAAAAGGVSALLKSEDEDDDARRSDEDFDFDAANNQGGADDDDYDEP